VGWIERRLRHGGRVFVAVRRQHASGSDELWLFPGGAIRAVRDRGLKNGGPVIGQWGDGPARWDWRAVLEAMRS
jgi:hypothetical protein